MKSPRLLLLVVAPLLFVLAGCGSLLNPYKENFRCRASEDNGQCVDTKTAYKEATGTGQNSGVKPAEAERGAEASRLARIAELLDAPQSPEIAAPRVLRVLLLPYKSNGDLFMSRYAYLQVEPADWVITGVDEGLE